MYHITANSVADGWIQTSNLLLTEGVNLGDLIECLNVFTEIRGFNLDTTFDDKFRSVFGDERIDYARAYTFTWPDTTPEGYAYKLVKDRWHETYFGRIVNYRDQFDQLSNVIHILKQGKRTKRCEMIVYDPLMDAKNMIKQPCLLAIDVKPRDDGLHLTATFRSQAVSKSGYGDYSALVLLGNFLSFETTIPLASVNILACSSHLRKQNKELANTKELLRLCAE